jgi:hypothetical protein
MRGLCLLAALGILHTACWNESIQKNNWIEAIVTAIAKNVQAG